MSLLRRRIACVLGPLFRAMPDWWRFRLYSRLVRDPFAVTAPQLVTRRIEPYGYYMTLNRSDWMERYAADTGWYYDAATMRILDRMLLRGDHLIDVGANVGFVSLAAATIVGASGSVHAFEPSGDTRARLQRNIALNSFSNVSVVGVALGDCAGELAFNEATHHGQSSIRSGGATKVQVRRGDSFDYPCGRLVMKVDVEGYELHVLRGFGNILDRVSACLVEVTDRYLREAGTSAAELLVFMQRSGFRSARIKLTMGGLKMVPLTDLSAEPQYDVIFFRDTPLTLGTLRQCPSRGQSFSLRE